MSIIYKKTRHGMALRSTIALATVASMLVLLAFWLSSCGYNGDNASHGGIGGGQAGVFTYNDAVGVVSSNWNPHTYQTTDESYPIEYITSGLYSFLFNDEVDGDGREPYTGYKIIPEMAESMPIDVTERIKETNPEYNIPRSATSGYAYTIDLNKSAVWENGTPINAETYVYSMRQLLDPALQNYRAADYYSGNLCIAGAEFYANQGQSKTLTAMAAMKNDKISDLDQFLEKYKDTTVLINWKASFSKTYDPESGLWSDKVEDKTVKTNIKIKDMQELFRTVLVDELGKSEDEAVRAFLSETYIEWSYPSEVSFDTVGIFKSGEHQITLVFGKALAGFQLLYSLTRNWIVYEPYYEAAKKQIGDTGAYASSYNTDLGSTMSYGPYKMTSYDIGKSMRFEKNDTWYGYTDGKHIYRDPSDGKIYQMYQTTVIDTQYVKEAATRKLMFLKGELMTYSLGADDFSEYRDSQFCYVTPSETVFFFIFNGHMKAIKEREAAEDFDTAHRDIETITLESFRRAVALTYDKDALSSELSPSRSGGYGLIGNSYIYDPESGATYRNTEQAKRALCDFYSVDPSKFQNLDDAVDSITGYDPKGAREFYKKAFLEALELGYITDSDGDGISDQTVEIVYSVSESTEFIKKTISYLNKKINEVTASTPFENKIKFIESAPLGAPGWSNNLKSGLTDTVLGGWSGSALDPYGVTDLYVNPSYQYDAQWFDSSEFKMEIELNTAPIGATPKIERVSMDLRSWSDALNGDTVRIGEREYCFGDGVSDTETRLEILARIESTILQTYNYIPMLQDASVWLLSKKAYYVVEDYNPFVERGGIRYLKYNYDDAAWSAFVSSLGGEVKY